MTDTPKPPMAVWLAHDCADRLGRNEDTEASDLQNKYHSVGPYVHLDQFLAEVERRASECAEEGLSFDPEFVDAARELAKEIKEGKA